MFWKTLAIALLVCALGRSAGPESSGRSRRTFWWSSVAVLVAASASDARTSWGQTELNPLLRGPDGRFGARGVEIKAALLGGTLVFQRLLLRHRRIEVPLGIANLGVAGWTAAAAVHNVR